MEIRILGAHNAEAEGTSLTSILVDGILALDAGGLTSSLSLTEQQKIKAVILTHHHFDHVRDLVTLGFNFGSFLASVNVYATSQTFDVVSPCLLDGKIYIDFSGWPSQESPALRLKTIEPLKTEIIEDYEVLAVPVKHAVPTVGYQVKAENGKGLFYTGDTGPGLSTCWEYISPQMLLIEVSGPNRFQDFLKSVGHLSAQLLKEELVRFRQAKGYLPHVVVIHLPPRYQEEVEQEVEDVAHELGTNINIGYEDMRITL